jgi:hypothetical protein
MTVRFYDLYASKSLSLDELREAVEAALGIEFEAHESDFIGGDYFLAGDPRGEEFIIQRNHAENGDEDEVVEAQYADFPILLQVNATARGDQLRGLLEGIKDLTFLRRAQP